VHCRQPKASIFAAMSMLGSGNSQASLETREQNDVGLQESSASQLAVLGVTGVSGYGDGDGEGVGVGLGAGLGCGLGVGEGEGVAPQASLMS